jgi:inosine/xanthosine triphosphatase
MHIFVGSTNPVKVNATINAASEHWPDVTVEGLSVDTGVDEQPRSDEETKQGAINRAKAAFALGLEQHPELDGEVLGMGLEGGVVDEGTEMWTTVWAVVIDGEGNTGQASGSRFLVPEEMAAKIRTGEEMGPVTARVLNEENLERIKTQEGLVGIVTEGFVDRTEEYQSIAKLALGMWYGRHWRQSHGLE